MKRIIAGLALFAFSVALIAAEVLTLEAPQFTVHLTDAKCPAKIHEFIREDWPFPVFAGTLEFANPPATAVALNLCYSIAPGGVTIVDENGDGPSTPVPIEKFHVPGHQGPTPNDGYHV